MHSLAAMAGWKAVQGLLSLRTALLPLVAILQLIGSQTRQQNGAWANRRWLYLFRGEGQPLAEEGAGRFDGMVELPQVMP